MEMRRVPLTPSRVLTTFVVAFLVAFIGADGAPRTRAQATGSKGKVIYSFQDGSDGAYPSGGFAVDAAGNLHGTAARGGGDGYGTVFESSPPANPSGA